VVNQIDKETITGKEIAFYGAFALKDPSNIVIIPVVLTVEG
jgi:predicted lipoprotein